MSDLQVWKAIWQIRFPPVARLIDVRGRIASEWQHKNGLSEWQVTLHSTEIHNPTKSIFLKAELEAISVVAESPQGFEEFSTLANNFSLEILDLLQVNKINRLGLRLIQAAPYPNFRMLVNKMRRALYKPSDDIWDSLGGIPQDVSTAFVFKLGEKMANMTIGPMEGEQLATYFESGSVKSTLPSSVIFFDMDLYQLEPKIFPKEYKKDVPLCIKNGISEIQNFSERFLDRFGGFK